ncbi:MAG: hypothetical protein Q7S21_07560 [archaeon]|nr:hypothetical protein [archaeon]
MPRKKASIIFSATVVAQLLRAAVAQAQDDGLPLHKDGNAFKMWAVKESHALAWVDKTGSKKPASSGQFVFVPFVAGKVAGNLLILQEKGKKPFYLPSVAGEWGRFSFGSGFRLGNSIIVAPGVVVNFGGGLKASASHRIEPNGKTTAGLVRTFNPDSLHQIFGRLTPREISAGLKSTVESQPDWTYGVEVAEGKTSIGLAHTPRAKKVGMQIRRGFGKSGSTYLGLTARMQRGQPPSYTAELHFVPKKPGFLKQKQPQMRRR